MKTIFEHIEHAKTKPHHIRKRIAFGIAGGASAFLALVWFVGGLSFGSFAIQGSTFADNGEVPSVVTASENGTPNVAGAAAALPSADEPARIEIVDTSVSAPAKRTPEQTTIPF